MSDQSFSTVRKGYDPTEVDQAMEALRSTIRRLENQLSVTNDAGEAAAQQALEHQAAQDALNAAVQKLTTQNSNLTKANSKLKAEVKEANKQLESAVPLQDVSFEHLGERVASILRTAHEDADSVRQNAIENAEKTVTDAQARAEQLLNDAQWTSDDTRSKAEAEAARVIEDANKRADDLRAQAGSEAAAIRDEAAALLETHRANATNQTIEFEKTLAERREEALTALDRDIAGRNAELAAATTELNQAKAEAQRQLFEAQEQADKIVRDSQKRAADILNDSQARADAMRENAQRELDAALTRRNSINEQLSGVRKMLIAYGAPGAEALLDVTDGSGDVESGEEQTKAGNASARKPVAKKASARKPAAKKPDAGAPATETPATETPAGE